MSHVRPVKRMGRRVVPLARRRAIPHSTPAPLLGWNARDPLSNMKEGYATILDNWFPEESSARVRKGYAEHVTGITGNVESLMAWNGPSSNKLFASANSAVYEVTSAGAVGSAEFSSLSSIRWQATNFENSAGSFLYIVNGADAPRYYNGSSWTTPTITGSGLTATNLIHVNAFKRRLFFIENNTLSFWYFPVETISGAISEFDIGPVCNKGGYLMAMGNWTLDAGDGVDDLAVFVTSEGEAVVYQGTNPGDSDAWAHVGTYQIADPIGRRCLLKYGADLLIITEIGLVPLAPYLAKGGTDKGKALTDDITKAYITEVVENKNKFGWQAVFYPQGNKVLVNVPRTNNTHQHVMNSTTKAWCRFLDWEASCFAVFDDELYFGGSGAVYKADTGNTDDDGDINAEARTAFSYLGHRGRVKSIKMARPNLTTDGVVGLSIGVNVDFEDVEPSGTATFDEPSGADWDTAVWDDASWGGGTSIANDLLGVGGVGITAALRFQSSTQGTIMWNSVDWLYELGEFV